MNSSFAAHQAVPKTDLSRTGKGVPKTHDCGTGEFDGDPEFPSILILYSVVTIERILRLKCMQNGAYA